MPSTRYLPESHKNQELRVEMTSKGDENSEKGNMDRLELERLLRRELHKSFDLNQSITPPNLPIERQRKIASKVGKRICLQNATKKKSLFNMALREEALTNHELDLELRLSTLPKKYFLSSSSSSRQNQSNSSTSLSQKPTSYPPFDLNSKDQDLDCTMVSEAADYQVPSLVLMGCTNCYLYVMVSQNDPKCPKCNTSILIKL